MDELKNRSDLKREQILKVAGQLFMEHGFNAVTMEAIAEAAPVSKPTLYNHFENKAALFFAVMEARADFLFHTIEGEIRHDRPIAETLTKMARSFLEIVLRPEAIRMYRIMIAEAANFPELGHIFYQSGPRKISQLISNYLAVEHKAGHLHVTNPDLSANFFINMIKGNGHMQCILALKEEIPPKERAEIIDYAVKVFLNGHTPNA